MKTVESSRLTSNSLLNKYLMMNTRLEDDIKGKKFYQLIFSEYSEKRLALDELKFVLFDMYCVQESEFDYSESFRVQLVKYRLCLEQLMYDVSIDVRMAVVSLGYRLDYFMYDESQYVRAQVAKFGYGLEVLSNDSSCVVSLTIVTRNHKFPSLENSQSLLVQEALQNR